MPPVSQPLHRSLLAWYAVHRRDLPWRATHDPYAVLVSEVMLQQTQVARVVPAYTGFLERFPTVTDLASGALADVLTAWQGLGYHRRARNLHLAARRIVDVHHGVVPDDLAALRALPGVGDYTARAVLAFAFGRDVAPVDTNVARVLARAVAGRQLTVSQAQSLADGLVPTGTAADWSAALMDLGAGLCGARRMRCSVCPLAAVCAWRRAGGAERLADPATARSRPQTPFPGSDRYHRGRLLDALRVGPVPGADLASAADLDDAARAARLADALVGEGLAEWCEAGLRLPR